MITIEFKASIKATVKRFICNNGTTYPKIKFNVPKPGSGDKKNEIKMQSKSKVKKSEKQNKAQIIGWSWKWKHVYDGSNTFSGHERDLLLKEVDVADDIQCNASCITMRTFVRSQSTTREILPCWLTIIHWMITQSCVGIRINQPLIYSTICFLTIFSYF